MHLRSHLLVLLPALAAALPAFGTLPQAPLAGGPDFTPVPDASHYLGFLEHAGGVVFGRVLPETGNEPWASGSPDGPTVLLGDFNAGPFHAFHNESVEDFGVFPLSGFEFGPELLFATHAGATSGLGPGDQSLLWATDGTVAGTRLLETFLKAGTTFPVGGVDEGLSIGARFVFYASGTNGGLTTGGIWGSDGTPGGASLLLATGDGFGFRRAGNRALFFGRDTNGQWFLWRTDGTPSGTVRVEFLFSDRAVRRDNAFLDHEFYFDAKSSLVPNSDDLELWKSNGVASGTQRVADIRPGPEGSEPRDFVAAGDFVYFTADGGSFGRELWRTDGSEAGTTRLTDFGPGALDGDVLELTESSGRLFFHAEVAGLDRLYRWDEALGAVEIDAFESLGSMAAIGSRRVFFFGRKRSGDPLLLWTTDGAATAPYSAALDSDLQPTWFERVPVRLANGQLFGVRLDESATPSALGLMAAPAFGTSDPFGQPCAASGFLPTLDATDPVLGSTSVAEIRGGEPGRPALLFFGLPAAPAVLGGACTLYADAGSLLQVGTGTLDAAGRLLFPALPVPDLPQLAGLRFALQALVGPTATSPLGFDVSNGVLLTLGE